MEEVLETQEMPVKVFREQRRKITAHTSDSGDL